QQLDKKGKTDELVKDYLSRLEKYQARIAALEEKEADKKLVETVKTLLEIPRNKIFWYRQGVQFLKKGITYNPDKYDLYFELGWTYYHKGMDYPNAVKYLEKAIKHPHPDYVDDVLAHAYEKNGQIDRAIAQWEYLITRAPSFRSIAERMIHDLKTKGKATP
ncbi:MAG TPA: tetratricopeptide repeat protein, partial [bacterium]|nr:tetratricopeptide repeat protein [bacterium]